MLIEQFYSGRTEWPIERIAEMSTKLPIRFRDAWRIYAVSARMLGMDMRGTIQEKYDFCAKGHPPSDSELMEVIAEYLKAQQDVFDALPIGA